MLSLHQRLMVGGTLLLAIVFGLALTLRTFVHRTTNLATQVDDSAHLQQTLSSLEPFIARERATINQLASAPFGQPKENPLANLSRDLRDAQQQFRSVSFSIATDDPTVSLKPLQQEHSALAAEVNRAI